MNLRLVRINAAVAIGALAALDVVSGAVTAASTSTYRLISVHAAYSIVDAGAGADDGQTFGLAHGDYSAAEIEECLEATTAIDAGDKIANERANRLVRVLGTFAGTALAGGGVQFNDSQPVKVRLNWLMTIGDTLTLWVRNASGAVYTTGASITIAGDLWVKDSA